MSPEFKKEYMDKFHLRYKKAKTRTEKSDLITELCITWRDLRVSRFRDPCRLDFRTVPDYPDNINRVDKSALVKYNLHV